MIMEGLSEFCKGKAAALAAAVGAETTVIDSDDRFVFRIGDLALVSIEKVGDNYAVSTMKMGELGPEFSTHFQPFGFDDGSIKQLVSDCIAHLYPRAYDMKSLVTK